MSIIAGINHVDTNITSSFDRAEELHGVEAANQGIMLVKGHVLVIVQAYLVWDYYAILRKQVVLSRLLVLMCL